MTTSNQGAIYTRVSYYLPARVDDHQTPVM
nr:MAG TPA: hypothetical protein [Bacteriophage sp.]